MAACVFMCLGQQAFAEGVHIDRDDAKVEERSFDPRHPPDPPPPVPAGLTAVTEYSYTCNAFCAVDYLDNGVPDGKGVRASVRVTEFTVQLALPITSWLPNDCSKWLREHERGHADISCRIYKPSAEIAEEIAKPLIGQVFEATGNTLDDARRDAIVNAAKSFCDRYHARTRDMAKQLDTYYDELTNHGMKRIPSRQAVEYTLTKFGY